MKSTTSVVVAAAKAANDPTTTPEDRAAAQQIIDRVCEIRIGDLVFIQTVTLYWCGTVAKWSDTEVVLVDATSVIETGEFQSLQSWSWKQSDNLPGDKVVRLSRMAMVAWVRKGGS